MDNKRTIPRINKYRIMFSIPVHERPDVIIDQIENINHYNPHCAVVLHISKAFNDKRSHITIKKFREIIAEKDNVFINPIQLETTYGNIVHTHISNFYHSISISDFDYFALLSSNELFVRSGMSDTISNYECGFNYQNITELKNVWPHALNALSDPTVEKIANHFGFTKQDAVRSQIEGTFYRKGLFEQICNIIEEYYDISKIPENIYPREEVYYQETAYFLLEDKRDILQAYITHNARDNASWTVYKSIIDKVSNGNSKEYSVKRIERDINNPSRAYIREKGLGYYNEVNELVPNVDRYNKAAHIIYDYKMHSYNFIAIMKKNIKKILKYKSQ